MGIWLAFLVCVIGFFIADVVMFGKEKMKDPDADFLFPVASAREIPSMYFWTFGVFFLVISCSLAVIQATAVDKYRKLSNERASIEYRIENELTDTTLYDDIESYNNSIAQSKKYVGDFWVGWFYSEKVASLDFVELEGIEWKV